MGHRFVGWIDVDAFGDLWICRDRGLRISILTPACFFLYLVILLLVSAYYACFYFLW